ncbi:hypothetical protein TWF281_010907 [Arthrobotrys megalospora]
MDTFNNSHGQFSRPAAGFNEWDAQFQNTGDGMAPEIDLDEYGLVYNYPLNASFQPVQSSLLYHNRNNLLSHDYNPLSADFFGSIEQEEIPSIDAIALHPPVDWLQTLNDFDQHVRRSPTASQREINSIPAAASRAQAQQMVTTQDNILGGQFEDLTSWIQFNPPNVQAPPFNEIQPYDYNYGHLTQHISGVPLPWDLTILPVLPEPGNYFNPNQPGQASSRDQSWERVEYTPETTAPISGTDSFVRVSSWGGSSPDNFVNLGPQDITLLRENRILGGATTTGLEANQVSDISTSNLHQRAGSAISSDICIVDPATVPNANPGVHHGVEEISQSAKRDIKGKGKAIDPVTDIEATSSNSEVATSQIVSRAIAQKMRARRKKKDATGTAQENTKTPIKKTGPSKRTGKLTDEARQNAAWVRKNGACIRCKIQRKTCGPGEQCQNCINVYGKARKFREVCFREDISKVALVRHCNARFGQYNVAFLDYRWADFDAAPIKLRLRWSLPGHIPSNLPSLEVSSREYQPGLLDSEIESTSYIWQVDGEQNVVKLPPHACYDIKELSRTVGAFIDESLPGLQQWVLDGELDELTFLSYQEALRFAKTYDSELIRLALRMQCGAVLSQGWGSVSGTQAFDVDTSGLKDSSHCNYDRYNNVTDGPIPQAIEHQIDVALLLSIRNDEITLLKLLKKTFFQREQKPWFELFLAYHVLLMNLEFIHRGGKEFILSMLKTMLEFQVSPVGRTQVSEWEHSAQVMLAYFRIVLRGFIPFSIAKFDINEVKIRAGLDDHSVIYLQNVVRILKQKEASPSPDVRTPRDPDEITPRRWLRQLFEEQFE